jgi:fumarate hydratase class II
VAESKQSASRGLISNVHNEMDSLGEVNVPADKLWGAQTQRSLEHFSIGKDLIPREMITAYAILKKAAVNANHAGKRLDIVKIGRTHMQDATPITQGQEWSGYAGMLSDDLERLEDALKGAYRLALRGTAVGTGINAPPDFAEAAAAEIAELTRLPFVSAPNKFTVQGAHDAMVQLSATFRTLAVSLYKIGNDPADVLRAACRLRRTHDSRERARLVDHARQGQLDPGRSVDDDRRASNGG